MKGDAALIPERIRAATFKKIMTLARKHDLLLISGDLFDNPNPEPVAISMVREEFKKLKNNGVGIVFTPGAGELDENQSIARFLAEISASHVFTETENCRPFIFSKDDQNIYIYGIPSSADYHISTITKTEEEGFHLGLFYADIDQNTAQEINPYKAYKLKKKAIRSLPLDFYAFGYNHDFKILKLHEKIIGACSGSPEATSYHETGDRYVISLEIKNSEIIQIKRIKVNSITMTESVMDCSEIDSQEPIINTLEYLKSGKVFLRLVLTGERNFPLSVDDLEAFKKEFFSLTVVDNTFPTLHSLIEKYREENTLRGEFYRILREKIEKNAIPESIEWKNLSIALNDLSEDKKKFAEEWLCSLKDA